MLEPGVINQSNPDQTVDDSVIKSRIPSPIDKRHLDHEDPRGVYHLCQD